MKIDALVIVFHFEDDQDFNAFEFAKLNPLLSMGFIFSMGAETVEAFMTNEDVKKLLNSNEKFDAVIVELCAIDALLGLGQHFDCPVIAVNTFDGVYWNDVYTGNQSPYSYVPMVFTGLPDKMTFSQRLSNTIYSSIEKLVFTFYHLRQQRKLYEKHFPLATRSFDEIHKSVSVLFMNSHVSSSSARPLLPNMIGINGIHVQPAKKLPEDIKNFLDSATDGVIVFSMGSFVKSTDYLPHQREAFVKTFGKLKQKVLWKYENETLPGNPGNIMISSWLPQRDAVAHPNVKVFITHGGNLGTTEALSEGVPLLGVPLFGDQLMNMKRAEAKGYGLTINFQNITEEGFSEALNELLTNPVYAQNAKRFSQIFKDRPMDPKQTVVYWSEHVVRHHGAEYLKATGRKLNFIEFHLIDVYATLFAGAFGVFFVFYKICKLILGLMSKKSTPKKQKKQKKK
jgi:glucuronosyltransferase